MGKLRSLLNSLLTEMNKLFIVLALGGAGRFGLELVKRGLKHMRRITRALLGAAAIACLAPAPASAVTINLIDVNGRVKGTAAEKGFRQAANFWSYMLTDNVTVNLQVDYAPLSTGVIGSTGSTRYGVTAAGVYAQLAATGRTNLDAVAVANLSPLSAAGGLSMITSGYDNDATKIGIDVTKRVWDNDNSANNRTLGVNSATLKALGFVGIPANNVDGIVTFSSNFAFDFDATNGIEAGQMDFVAVAIHEIGHALGFTSGVDIYDNPANVNNPNVNANGSSYLFTTLDLFRYSNDPTNVAPGSGPVLDFAVGSPSYFSIDGGRSMFNGNSLFSTGRNFGDGQQASHFKDLGGCGNQIGIMDPNLCRGQLGEIEGADLAAFDAMGWNLRFDVLRNRDFLATSADVQRLSVPEPSTWAMLIAGFGMIGGAMRRASRRKPAGATAAA